MNIKIEDILKRKGDKIVTVKRHVSIDEAVHLMASNKIGALVVEDDAMLEGIITERDVLHALDENGFSAVAKMKVEDIMTSQVHTGSPEDDITYVMTLMSKHHFRHMPVVVNGKLAGLVSSKDVVTSALAAESMENRILKHYIKNWPEEDEQTP